MVQVASISQRIWDMKYRLKYADGRPVDKNIEDTWARLATALSEPETENKVWQQKFYNALELYLGLEQSERLLFSTVLSWVLCLMIWLEFLKA